MRTDVTAEGSGRQRILLHLGVLTRAAGTSFAESASRGGPLGELVQWSDLIASLHALGHELVVTTELEDLLLAMTPLLLTLVRCSVSMHSSLLLSSPSLDSNCPMVTRTRHFSAVNGYLLHSVREFRHSAADCSSPHRN